MDIEKELEISDYQIPDFGGHTELYDTLVEHWNFRGIDPFAAAAFFSAGRVCGIRQERARKRRKKA